MKKRILLVAVLQLVLIISGCSSDSGDNSTPTPEPPVVIIKTAKVTSYSKNAGETGETISIYGENFSDKMSDIKITFDGVAATIVSTTAAEIKFTLPQSETTLPKVILTIAGKQILNEVKNDYNGNIGILPKSVVNTWFTIPNTNKTAGDIGRIQFLNNKIIYYAVTSNGGDVVYRTLDGGISWSQWSTISSSNSGFHALSNGSGWIQGYIGSTGSGVYKLPDTGGIAYGTRLWTEINSANPGIYSAYVDDNLQKGTIVSQRGDVYTTSNGTDFIQVYDAHLNDEGYKGGFVIRSVEIDNDHIWTAGQKTVDAIKYPFILFKNNETDGWKEHYLVNEPDSYIHEIFFADAVNGFVLIRGVNDSKFYKTTNSGDTWAKVYTGEKFTKFAFKDANTGWAVLENKIYKTVDGATTWTLDYTHDQPIKTIAYKNNLVWAIATDKIIKRIL
ncbi:IPT/TIG domain-containing protein [Flavobacterium geliluteum]|uniref:IPT/TIG domain-containing protein n=1 Tax=Flavobacterium geliluteum TaxID=2816120 RepID=A0A941AVC9_9FLAO|nr:IPT/TIG domain-containing protein [Flavobacterium geliluteum]MBP4137454.1 IPT/TIG domain-containing protein [Flavobacterium geliluteum]